MPTKKLGSLHLLSLGAKTATLIQTRYQFAAFIVKGGETRMWTQELCCPSSIVQCKLLLLMMQMQMWMDSAQSIIALSTSTSPPNSIEPSCTGPRIVPLEVGSPLIAHDCQLCADGMRQKYPNLTGIPSPSMKSTNVFLPVPRKVSQRNKSNASSKNMAKISRHHPLAIT